MSTLVRLQKATELIHNYFVSHLKIVDNDKKLILMMLIISYLPVFYIQRSFVHRKFDISNTFNAKYLKMWILLLKYALGSLENAEESYNIRVEGVQVTCSNSLPN